ncbi:MAG: hypothetical protein FJX76_01980 [Armatimonadetes bacterium]|nr:hypothetical protein [Armatimonadota bacterium]
MHKVPYHLLIAALLAILIGSGCGSGGQLAENGTPEGAADRPGAVSVTIHRSALQSNAGQDVDLSGGHLVVSALDPVTDQDLIAPLVIAIPTNATEVTVALDGIRVGITRIEVEVFTLSGILVAETSTIIDVLEGLNSTVTMQPQPVSPTPNPTPSPTPFTPLLFVTNQLDNTVMSFRIENGPAVVEADTQTTGTDPVSVALASPGGSPRFLYVANSGAGAGSITSYSVDPNSGAMTPLVVTPISGGERPVSLAVNEDGTNLYAATTATNANHVFAFNIHPSSGLINQIGGPHTVAGLPTKALVAPDFLLVSHGTQIAQFPFVAGGDLGTSNDTSTIDALTDLTGRGITSTLPSLLFGISGSTSTGNIRGFTFSGSGVPTPLLSNPTQDAPAPSATAIHPTRDFLYTANRGDNSLRTYQLGPSGAPSFIGQETTSISNPTDMFIPGDGGLIFLLNAGPGSTSSPNGNIGVHAVTGTGTTTFVTSVETGPGPTAITGN